ncbi:DNA polymerase domain-containing protein [Acidisoma sp. S159]|uniref:DNA polymerase domain-containing protein n=1 Tax=Acidisoma sp. S159 TaxID=1747225 RepID=UPI00131E077D|nr:DNA polymerase domain-containing protein [Acidisoma sp. S159]
MTVAVRAYAVKKGIEPAKGAGKPGRKKKPTLRASKWTLVFDTETTTNAGQALRFGAYQLRNGDSLDEKGIFFDPEGVTSEEMGVLRQHAEREGLTLRDRSSFVDDIFFERAYKLRAAIVGFNLPFDISRLAISHGSARTPGSSESAAVMQGGFTFRLSRQKIYPNVRIKHLSRKAALISFAATMGQRDGRGQRRRNLSTGIRRGHFIDVSTLANALLARGFTLNRLSEFLQVQNPKLEFDAFDESITEEMIRYAVRDVQATWECYVELIHRFNSLHLAESLPEKIYSEAGIGKGYIRAMGVRPWREVQPDFPTDLIGRVMGTYYGGRSEVRIRREIRQVILCDFLSMYPTVCTLMGLWRFAIADGLDWHDATVETKLFLNKVDLNGLQSKATWGSLAVLVRVLPDADIFPVRAAYGGAAQSTIGANYLSAEKPLWFTLADCIAAKLLSGKAPQVVEAISFAPQGVQSGLKPIAVAGNPDYAVDPRTGDFFQRVIELRQSVKKAMKSAEALFEQDRLDTEQHAIKICANSTSYGIWVEINVDYRPQPQTVEIHSATGQALEQLVDKVEMPGTFFHPLLATLITGAARLMLAMTERLISYHGLDWVFCDTDSMAIAKPAGLDPEVFRGKVEAIAHWFEGLNPYNFAGSILKIEDVNNRIATHQPEPLYCFAVSSKRYVLFNLTENSSPIMRKVSAHGLGHLRPPYGEDDPPICFPTPDVSVLKDGTLRWHCDLWHQIVVAALKGEPDQVSLNYHPTLQGPAISRYSASSPDLLSWFKSYNAGRSYRDQVKPFNFLLTMSAARIFERDGKLVEVRRGRRKRITAIKPVAPFDSDHNRALLHVFDRETGALLLVSALRSYADALAQYHISPETKFLNGDYLDRGITSRRHIQVDSVRHIGKESNDWERQAILGFDKDAIVDYNINPEEWAAFTDLLQNFVDAMGVAAAARVLGVTNQRVKKLVKRGAITPDSARFPELLSGLQRAVRNADSARREEAEAGLTIAKRVDRVGLRKVARGIGVDPSNLRRKLKRRKRSKVAM